jgi:hypothetical protein
MATAALRIAGHCEKRWRTTTLAEKRDCLIMFAHAAWSGTIVAVFVDGGYCGQIKAAYGLATGRAIDFGTALKSNNLR